MTLPTDMVHQEICGERLKIPLTRQPAMNDLQTEEYVLDLIQKRVEEAEGNMVILVDACVIRFGVQEEVKTFLERTGFPVYSTPMGKTAVDESYSRYGGVSISIPPLDRLYTDVGFQIYIGTITHPLVKERVESTKLVMSIGSLQSDFNTGNFSYNIPTGRHIEVSPEYLGI